VQFIESPLATREELVTTHCPKYVDRYISGNLLPLENRRIGFPWSIEHVNRSRSSTGGTIAAMRTLCSSATTVSVTGA
jgi:acetoin utilization deacetylase AcuC-like enzyme